MKKTMMVIDHHGDDGLRPEAQAGPSVPLTPALGADTEVNTDPDPVLSTLHGLASVNESMVTSLSSITNLSAISNTTATNIQIATEVSRYIHGALHCQQHISQWLPSIQANFPQNTAAISILTKIIRVMDQALVSTYSVGCFRLE